jgi:hypothetical protein
MSENPSATLPGTVEKIIKSPHPGVPEKAQIAVEGADHLYREIRIDNTLIAENGAEVLMRMGIEVEVTVEAKPEDTIPAHAQLTANCVAPRCSKLSRFRLCSYCMIGGHGSQPA